MAELRAGGLVIADAFFNSQNERLAALALRNAIPTVSPYREFAVAGGLMRLRGQHHGVATGWGLCRPTSQLRKARRAAGPAGGER